MRDGRSPGNSGRLYPDVYIGDATDRAARDAARGFRPIRRGRAQQGAVLNTVVPAAASYIDGLVDALTGGYVSGPDVIATLAAPLALLTDEDVSDARDRVYDAVDGDIAQLSDDMPLLRRVTATAGALSPVGAAGRVLGRFWDSDLAEGVGRGVAGAALMGGSSNNPSVWRGGPYSGKVGFGRHESKGRSAYYADEDRAVDSMAMGASAMLHPLVASVLTNLITNGAVDGIEDGSYGPVNPARKGLPPDPDEIMGRGMGYNRGAKRKARGLMALGR